VSCTGSVAIQISLPRKTRQPARGRSRPHRRHLRAESGLAFGLLYWLMDGGGPLARSRKTMPVDFAFTQQMSPELAPPGWQPVFLDYLHLGFTNATAFSPTDVMPLTHRAERGRLRADRRSHGLLVVERESAKELLCVHWSAATLRRRLGSSITCIG
jgi:hypothetical protein